MIIIGEKISVIAKKVREAMDARDPKPIQDLAMEQWKAGAHFIDVNIGPAEDKGEDLMKWMVEIIQEKVQAPLCLDTTNASALEAGLKVHNNEWGKALINSTSNDPERFGMLELAAKYESEIIALTVGKGGLPADSEERCGIAAEIMGRAMEFGVPLENIYLDPLILQVCTTQDQAMHSMKAIQDFQDLNDPPMKTVVGLSNISNGVPRNMRSLIDKTYLVLLMYAGLTAAIANPLDKDLVDVMKTTDLFLNKSLYADSYLDM
ncbi:MAG: dihydropteroate synthase [Nitrospira sp.]|nr:dihydropteroate synthase [bacterium]MBL7049559.1 dihydropteroate synthase [Nitrospira sp.]